jgi:acetolactate synthase-1/2/3 large subunit
METPRTGADVLVRGLIDAGVECLFGLPGDTGVDLYDALHGAKSTLRHVLCRDERHAAIMADAYARCRNTIGVLEVSSGGGATYCIGGLGEPFAASIPLLVISSDIHVSSRNSGALTELDQEKLFSSVTKWVRRADRADDLPALLREALIVATSDRPAPVAIIVPENVLVEKTRVSLPPAIVALPAHRAAADPEVIAAVAAALTRAERPAIVVGGGVHASQAYQELAELAEAAAVPIGTTIHGKGTYPETAPWSLGVVGGNGGRPYANEYLAAADFVLLVGTRANATDTNSYRSPPRSTSVAQLDIAAERATRNYPAGIPIVADAKSALAALRSAIGKPANRRTEIRRRLEALRDGWRNGAAPASKNGAVHPLTVFRTVQATFGSDALLVADCGTATPYLAAHWETTTVGRRMIMPRGHGAMGFAIPGSVGAAVAKPGTRVVAITTDGSLGMSCGELETAARLRLPITFVQLTNGSFGWIKMLQHLYHDRRYFGVDIGRIDSPAIAEGFGVPARRVDTQGALEDALITSGSAAGPVFIEVIIPDMTTLEPPVASWTAALSGADTSRPVY